MTFERPFYSPFSGYSRSHKELYPARHPVEIPGSDFLNKKTGIVNPAGRRPWKSGAENFIIEVGPSDKESIMKKTFRNSALAAAALSCGR
jgi:hypothetical protein